MHSDLCVLIYHVLKVIYHCTEVLFANTWFAYLNTFFYIFWLIAGTQFAKIFTTSMFLKSFVLAIVIHEYKQTYRASHWKKESSHNPMQ